MAEPYILHRYSIDKTALSFYYTGVNCVNNSSSHFRLYKINQTVVLNLIMSIINCIDKQELTFSADLEHVFFSQHFTPTRSLLGD